MKTLTRSFFALAILASLGLMSACGSSSGSTPVGVPITISLSASSTNINEGGNVTITATVTGDTTNAGVTWSASAQGCTSNSCLSNVTTTSVTYTAPAKLYGTTVASITATSKADTSVNNSIQITVTGATITVTANPSTINAGEVSNITATVTNESSTSVNWTQPSVGTLTKETATTAVYNAPASVTSVQQVTITATSTVDSSLVGTATVTVCPSTGCNFTQIVVDGGPVSTQIYANGAFATVTICPPGSSSGCATVDHLLVDTGSFGLRVLQSELALTLTPITSSGQNLYDCVHFVDGSFLWGEVALANVQIGGETASSIPIQVVADPPGGFSQIPTTCSNSNSSGDEDNQAALGANGILGVGPEPDDCSLAGTNYCTTGVPTTPIYYACSGNPLSCTTPEVPVSDQVTNPVVAFPTDNNGTVITFPSVGPAEAKVTGTLIFGIGTQSNNTVPTTATVYQLDSSDNFSTTYSYVNSGPLPQSFIDSGSNAYFIPDDSNTIAICTGNISAFFCPSQNLTSQTATTASNVTTASGTVTFEIDNANTLFTNYPSDAAFGTLGGPNDAVGSSCTNSGSGYTGDCSFDWGLPFFYNRTVFTSIDGQSVPAGQPPAPWWAY